VRITWILVICLTGLLGVAGAFADEGDKPVDPRLLLADEGAEYVGASQCMMCHSETMELYLGTKHALSLGNSELPPSVVGCEMCHGPGSMHMSAFTNDPGERAIVDFDQSPDSAFTGICLNCHRSIATFNEFASNMHANSKVYCSSCHDPHANKFKFAMLRKPANDLCASCHKGVYSQFESGLSAHPVKKDDFFCTDCHNPHNSERSMLVREGISKTCGGCHEYTRQSYVFPHISEYTDPAEEACLYCHNPHASGTNNLLRFSGRTLCLTCHSDKAMHMPGATCWTAGCHSQIHGSNDNPMFVK